MALSLDDKKKIVSIIVDGFKTYTNPPLPTIDLSFVDITDPSNKQIKIYEEFAGLHKNLLEKDDNTIRNKIKEKGRELKIALDELRRLIYISRDHAIVFSDNLKEKIDLDFLKNTDFILNEISDLEKTFDNITFDEPNNRLIVTTREKTVLRYQGVDLVLGKFKIILLLNNIKNVEHNIAEKIVVEAENPKTNLIPRNIDYVHPHVHNGIVCFGTINTSIHGAMRQARIYDVFALVQTLLHSRDENGHIEHVTHFLNEHNLRVQEEKERQEILRENGRWDALRTKGREKDFISLREIMNPYMEMMWYEEAKV